MIPKTILVPSPSNLVLVLAPLLLLFLPIYFPGEQSTCGYVILLVAAYWISNCLPMGITGLLPVALFGITGILTITDITKVYFFSGFWLVYGSLMLAAAVQFTHLHRRIALKILLTIGTDPKRLLVGFMVTAHLLSMFIANLAVLAMLLPIAQGVLKQVKEQIAVAKSEQANGKEPGELQLLNEKASGNGGERRCQIEKEGLDDIENGSSLVDDDEDDDLLVIRKLQAAVIISIPYCCSIGGVSTLSGSALNIIANDLMHSLFPGSEKISFVTWFIYCAPGAFLITAFSCIWMIWLHLGFRSRKDGWTHKDLVRRLLQAEYEKFGPINWAEGWVLALFILTTILWLTRSPGFMPGWGELFPKGYVTDGTVALATGIWVFIIPKNKPVFFGHGNRLGVSQPKILTFKEYQDAFPWEVIFIAGGGLTISFAAMKSGLSGLVASQLLFVNGLPPWVACVIITSFSSLLTEGITGMAIFTFLMPILANLAVTMRVHPVYFCLPMFLCTVQGFMLPVATALNAMAYSTGLFTMKDMARTGCVMNVIGLFIINVSINTYGKAILGLGQFPQWAETGNMTKLHS